MDDQARRAECYRQILASTLGPELTPGTEETPLRAAKAWAELTSGYATDIASLFKTFDSEGNDEMIAVSGMSFSSLCEHHLLPFEGHAHVVYVPDGEIVGLSKIPRVLRAFSRRLQVQERLTSQIADAMVEHLNPKGVMVVVEASHSCMRCRGIESSGLMVTSALRGVLKDDGVGRAEAFALIGRLS